MKKDIDPNLVPNYKIAQAIPPVMTREYHDAIEYLSYTTESAELDMAVRYVLIVRLLEAFLNAPEEDHCDENFVIVSNLIFGLIKSLELGKKVEEESRLEIDGKMVEDLLTRFIGMLVNLEEKRLLGRIRPSIINFLDRFKPLPLEDEERDGLISLELRTNHIVKIANLVLERPLNWMHEVINLIPNDSGSFFLYLIFLDWNIASSLENIDCAVEQSQLNNMKIKILEAIPSLLNDLEYVDDLLKEIDGPDRSDNWDKGAETQVRDVLIRLLRAGHAILNIFLLAGRFSDEVDDVFNLNQIATFSEIEDTDLKKIQTLLN